MAKVTGFNKSYSGLKESEAWQRIYEYGKNFMPIKEHALQKKYNKIFNKNTKVIRDNVISKVNTDKLVPGDIIILERGDFSPVDGFVLEEGALEFDEFFSPEDAAFKDDINYKMVYQGMKLKNGRAIIKAIRTGEATYLGSFIKKIDKKSVCECNMEKVLHKYANIIGCIGLVLLLFGAIFSFVTNEGDILMKLSAAGYSGLLLFLAVVPVGSILVLGLKMIEQKSIIRKSNLEIKKFSTLLKAHKTDVICLNEKFLDRNYEKYIERFYNAGIMIAIISEKDKDELKNLAKNAGLFEGDTEAISGKELEEMVDDKFYQTICNTIIFYKVNKAQKAKIVEGFYKLNIKTISVLEDIEDLRTIEYTDIGVCTHKRKRNLEYEFSDANINGTELTSLYSLIKGSCMIKNYLNHYLKYYIMFQLPVILSLLVALLTGLQLRVFYFQTLMFIIAIVPLLLLLVNRDYSEELIFELKKRNKTFGMSCIKFGFVGFFAAILSIGLYILLSKFNLEDTLKISCVTIFLTIVDTLIIGLSRKKFSIQINKSTKKEVHEDCIIGEDVVTETKAKEIESKKTENIKKEKIKTIKEKNIKEKINKEQKVKERNRKRGKANIEDIKDKLM